MTQPIKNLLSKVYIARLCANLSYAALLSILTIWALTRDAGFSFVLWAIVCLPLLILLPGIYRKRHRSYSWLCFVILLYFIKAVEGSMSSMGSWTDFSILVLSVIIFVTAMLTSRWLQYSRVQLNQSDIATDKDLP